MGLLQLMPNLITLLFFVVAILLAITVHEFSHAWVANYLGDPTAKKAGRVTLNPLAHLDPLGTIALILVRFGWGKPVPINPNNFKNPRLGSALTALAGPISNFIFANIVALTINVFNFPAESILGVFFSYVIWFNLVLMVFNLLPIPPLDGSKFFALFFPALDNPKYEVYGPFVLIVFVLVGGATYILPVIQFLLRVMGVSVTF